MALPVITYLYGFPVLNPDSYFFDALNSGVFQPATATKLVLKTPEGAKIVFKGNFTVDGMGVVTGGTVTGFVTFADGTKVQKGSGYAIDATDLIEAIAQFQLSNDVPLEQLLFDIPTKFVGSEQNDVIGNSVVGSVVVGRKGDDLLFAGAPDMTLKGGKGNDFLAANDGLCFYVGGKGQDVFVFEDPNAGNKVGDFSVDDDLFRLNPNTFVGVGIGFLDDSQFKVGKQASTPEQIILYWKGKGRVLYDQDGSESVYQPVQFAKVGKGLDISAQHFYGDIGGLA